MPLDGKEYDAIANLVGMMNISQEKAKFLYDTLNDAGLLKEASQAFVSMLGGEWQTGHLVDSEDYKLHLSNVATLPPHQWIVRANDKGVIIGAWVNVFKLDGDYRPTVYKRFFKFDADE